MINIKISEKDLIKLMKKNSQVNIKISEKDLIRLMKENPQINIKNGDKLYFKKDKKSLK